MERKKKKQMLSQKPRRSAGKTPPPESSNLSAGTADAYVSSVEIDQVLYDRLRRSQVIKPSPEARHISQRQVMQLDPASAAAFLNGRLFGQYVLVLKDAMEAYN